MRFGTLAKGSLVALLTLTGCGTDNFLTNQNFKYTKSNKLIGKNGKSWLYSLLALFLLVINIFLIYL